MTAAPLDAAGFQAATGVSRETLARLEAFLALLRRWQQTINLVGASTLDDPWRRHILDSAQLLPLIPDGARSLLDVGSGAGLPGLVLAILGVPGVHLVEADARKAAFLRESARLTGTPATVHARRLEAMAPFPVDVITARAVAPLPVLLESTAAYRHSGTVCLFLKGESAEQELTVALKTWNMHVTRVASVTSRTGTILRLEGITDVGRGVSR